MGGVSEPTAAPPRDPAFAEGYDEGFQRFKLGVVLKMARKEAGMTQEEVAKKVGTKKSAISRLENKADDMNVSTLLKFLKAVGKELKIA